MPGAVSPFGGPLSPDVLRTINAICLQFERSWRAAPPWPRLEDWLTGVEGPPRATLLLELLRLDRHYRTATGDPACLEEYQKRFPGEDEALQGAFSTVKFHPSERPARHAADPASGQAESCGVKAGDAPWWLDDVDPASCRAEAGSPPASPPARAGSSETGPPPLGARTAEGIRFHILRPHARGGLGEVFVAHDGELNRQVALKEIRDEYVSDRHSRARFVLEAEVTGNLEHPGIVPVYSLGNYPDGRPFYAMRFIQGDSLKDVIEDFHQAEGPQRDPGQRSLELRQLLGRFVAVCNAIAYAHSRGVLHRDLKPANVMVGQYGETLVVDWGLARPVEGTTVSGLETQPALEPSSATIVAKTLAGSVKGTPAYMSPEQASGRVDLFGPATDVYGLGATLYQLLTGRMPFEDKDTEEVLRRVRKGEFKVPRQVNRHVSVALDAICRKAMAREPKDRYPTARALAEDIEHWLADEPVTAYREPLATRVRRWARRHKPLVTGMAAALLTALVLGGVSAWWQQRQEAKALAQRHELDGRVRQATDQARTLLAEAWQAHDAEKLAAAQAEADKAVELALSGASVDAREEAEALRTDVQAKAEKARKNQRLMAALLDVAEPQETDRYKKDESGRVVTRAQPTSDQQFSAAFRHWGVDPDRDPAEQVVALLGGQPAPVVQEVVAGLDEWSLERRRANRPEIEWRRLSNVASQLDGDPRRRELRRLREGGALQQEWEAVRSAKLLARWLAIPDQFIGPNTRRLRELAGQMDPAKEPVLGVVALARAFEVAGDPGRADQVLRAALAARPQEVLLLDARGKLLERQQPPRWGEAIECYRAARSLRPQLAIALAKALIEANRAVEGEEIFRDKAERQPDNPELQFYLGNALADQKKFDEAVAAYRKAIQLQPDHPGAHNNLGMVLADQKKLDEAVAAYRKAIQLQPDLVAAHNNLGMVLANQKKLDEAVAAYRKAIQLQPDLAEAYHNLGNALDQQKNLDEAVAAYRKAVRLKPDYAEAYNNFGKALCKQKKLGEAVAAFHKAIQLQPDLAEAHNNLGIALHHQNRPDEAVAASRKALQLQPDLAEAYHNLGNALADQEKFDEAVAAYRKAIQLQPDLAEAYHNLGKTLYQQKNLDEAVAAFRKAVQLKPDDTLAHINLGVALHQQKKLDEAVAAFRKAIQLQPDLAEAFHNLGKALAHQEKLGEAVAAFRKAIQLQPDYAKAHYDFGVALFQQKKLDEAVAAFHEADKLLPGDPTFQRTLRQTERWLALDKRLPATLAGTEQPRDPEERIEFADFLTFYKHQYIAAVKLYTAAFAKDPKLAEDVRSGHRYRAACAAALAAAGKGKDATDLAAEEWAWLQRRAFDWLRADLTACANGVEKGDKESQQFVQQQLTFWQQEADLLSVRDKDWLAAMPASDRDRWQELWADVEALRKRAAERQK